MDIASNLPQLFDMLKEGVFAVRDGEVLYHNSAAARIYPDIASGIPQEIRDGVLNAAYGKSYTGSVVHNDSVMNVSVAEFGDLQVITLHLTEEDDTGSIANVLGVFGGALSDKLSVIMMADDFISEHIGEVQDEKYLQCRAMLRRNYSIIQRLARNMLFLSRPDDELSGVKEYFDISTVFSAVASAVADIIPREKAVIEFVSDADRIMVCAVRLQLQQMLLNMISNSLGAVKPGGTIRISLNTCGEKLMVRVSDNGSGIPAEIMNSIWNRYMHMDACAPVGKTGIGMSVIRRVAMQHGGNAVLESVPGEGTAVTVLLPIISLDDSDFILQDSNRLYGSVNGAVWPDNDEQHLFMMELAGVLTYDHFDQKYLD